VPILRSCVDVPSKITSPHDEALDILCRELAAASPLLDLQPRWPQHQLRLCGQYGVYEWFVSQRWGGQGWSDVDQALGYLRLASACLTTTFILTQRTAASRRIELGHSQAARQTILPGLAGGELFATVGISHLTTSRRHLRQPVMSARRTPGGYVLQGVTPWVTGGAAADYLVVGATLDDGSEILAAVDARSPGLHVEPPAQLLGLTASSTGPVRFQEVQVPEDWILAGPVPDVMQHLGGGTGGLQTSALALGLADAAVQFLDREAARRPDLRRPLLALREEHELLVDRLLQLAAGQPPCSAEELRAAANSHVLRAAQAALAAAKGTGYVAGHPAGRWCREALFFLVWSCPQPVMAANLCELAGIDG
jgi:alkylation response protein AidB-like acyl-CoA dehydrogenase